MKISNEKITTFATGFATGAISALSLGYLWCRLRCKPNLACSYTKLVPTQSPKSKNIPAFASNSANTTNSKNTPTIEM
jgi:hypothetical protein